MSIIKFEEAAGFECSQNLMDNLIQRYRTVDINFKKLASVLHNLAEIYETKADFKQKMLAATSEEQKKTLGKIKTCFKIYLFFHN